MLFVPLRMKPVPNFNLFIFPLFIAGFLYLFYKACSTAMETKAYLYAYFAGMLLWQVLGEMSSLRVNEGLILQFSDVNIKTAGGIARKSEESLLQLEGLGEKGIEEIKKALKKLGLELK